MKNLNGFYGVLVCLWVASLGELICGSDGGRVAGNGGAWGYLQPCQPYDSCNRRCVKGPTSSTSYLNVTIGHFNCFCDSDCEVFGDCCLDYQNECVVHSQPKKEQSGINPSLAREIENVLTPRNQTFECVVVDQFSEGSFWMVTGCSEGWPQDDVQAKCSAASDNALDSSLPVLGETGWTYRNVFCAQCNHVKKFYYWALMAKCVRSAPEEVLLGDPQMISYYLQHFCTVELQQDLTFSSGEKLNRTLAGDIKHSLAWKRSLRSCEQNIISSCPKDYDKPRVISLCENYQSIILKKDKEDPHKLLVFKNPMCALCHGYDFSGANKKLNVGVEDHRGNAEERLNSYGMSCPIWILTTHYDNAFWKLDTNTESSQMLPSFNKNYKTSSWAPPSFSILMRFQENGEADITYSDGSSTCVTIPTQQGCGRNEIYDPFVGSCRLVMCSNDMQYVDGECVGQGTNATNQTDANDIASVVGVTITISIVLPIPEQANYTSDSITADDIAYLLVEAFESVLNISAGNITILDHSTSPSRVNDTNSMADGKVAGDDNLSVAISFVVLEINDYTDQDILQLIEHIGQTVGFHELFMTMDTYSVLVMERNSPSPVLQCSNGTERVEYTSDEFELLDGSEALHVTATDAIYLEGQFQLLDWIISINGSGAEIGYMEETRVAVCFGNATIEHLCDIYLPLNASEYIELANGSLLLTQHDMVIPPDQYIDYQGSYAICLDGYHPKVEPDEIEILIDSTDVVISWVTFGLTIVSLTSLFFTFVTYCLFRELRSVSGWNTMNLTVALFAALLTFSVGASLTDPPSTCTAIAMFLHYLFLATFFWNNVMAFDVWLTFGKGIKQTYQRSLLNHSSTVGRTARVRRIIVKYMAYGWGMPALVVASCAVAEFGFQGSNFGYRYPSMTVCWISNPLSNVLAFGTPLAVILLANGVFFTLSICAIRQGRMQKRRHSSCADLKRTRKSSFTPTSPVFTPETATGSNDNVFIFPETPSESNTKSLPKLSNVPVKQPRPSVTSTKSHKISLSLAQVNVLVYVKMSTVMGFTWAFGFLSSIFPEVAPLRYVFEITVPLQGVFILVAFVCKRRIWDLYKGVCSQKTPVRKGTFFKRSRKPVQFLDQCIQNRRKAQRKMAVGVKKENVPTTDLDNSASISEDNWTPPPAAPNALPSLQPSPCCFLNQAYHSDRGKEAPHSPESIQDDYL